MNLINNVIVWMNSVSGIVSLFFAIIAGITALIILRDELKKRRELQEQALKFQEKEHEENRKFQQEELGFQKEKFDENKMWLQEQRENIREFSSKISIEVANQLKEDVSWASIALDKAKIKPSSQTLFAERWDHFKEEKEFIATKFIDILMGRLKFLSEKYSKVFLLIDSGTTLYPFFEKIGKSFVNYVQDDWRKKVVLITNNLPGVDSLMQHGRIHPNLRYTPLAIECKLLPGAPLPVYSAVTGEDTISFLQHVKKTTDNSYLLSLTTGNWIRIRRTKPTCPVPLARGKGHFEFKQVLLNESNEIYVISPLGKIFVDADPKDVNNALNFHDKRENPEYHEYQEVVIDDKKAAEVSLISTSRDQNRVLTELSIRLKTTLGLKDTEDSSEEEEGYIKNAQIKHTLFHFDNLPKERHAEREVEFPHKHTRKKNFMKKFFYVDY